MSTVLSRWVSRGARLVLAGMLVARAARAEPMADTTVLVLGAESAALTGRLRAELETLGLRVLVEGGDVSLEELEGRAHAVGAAVALSATESSEGVELRLVDRVTGKTLLREVLQRDLSSTDPDAVLALRAVELLRASLLELELGHPARGEIAVTSTLRETIRRAVYADEPAVPRLSDPKPANGAAEHAVLSDVGIVMLAHPGETRPQAGVSAALWWQPTRALAVGLWGAVPFGSVNVSASEGAADVRSNVFGSGLRFMPWVLVERLTPALGAGASVLWSSIDGTRARSDLVLASEELIAVGPYAEIGCGLAIARGLTLRSDVRAVLSFPKPVIQFADREVTALGRPFVTATFGLEYRAVVSAPRD